MARMRTIKPGFFTNEGLCDLTPLARLLFAGLWCWADREGRLEDRPRRLKAEILPYDDVDAEELLSALAAAGFVARYAAAGKRVIQIVQFAAHQNPHYKEASSTLPPAPPPSDSAPRDGVDPSDEPTPEQPATLARRSRNGVARSPDNRPMIAQPSAEQRSMNEQPSDERHEGISRAGHGPWVVGHGEPAMGHGMPASMPASPERNRGGSLSAEREREREGPPGFSPAAAPVERPPGGRGDRPDPAPVAALVTALVAAFGYAGQTAAEERRLTQAARDLAAARDPGGGRAPVQPAEVAVLKAAWERDHDYAATPWTLVQRLGELRQLASEERGTRSGTGPPVPAGGQAGRRRPSETALDQIAQAKLLMRGEVR